MRLGTWGDRGYIRIVCDGTTSDLFKMYAGTMGNHA